MPVTASYCIPNPAVIIHELLKQISSDVTSSNEIIVITFSLEGIEFPVDVPWTVFPSITISKSNASSDLIDDVELL